MLKAASRTNPRDEPLTNPRREHQTRTKSHLNFREHRETLKTHVMAETRYSQEQIHKPMLEVNLMDEKEEKEKKKEKKHSQVLASTRGAKKGGKRKQRLQTWS